MLQINNPTQGTVWATEKTQMLIWSGHCAPMGAAGGNVSVELVTGPSGALRYVTNLGKIDCSNPSITRADLTIPADVKPGTYAIIVRTNPDLSYTNMFEITNSDNPNKPDDEAPTPGTPEPVPTAGKDSTNNAVGALAISPIVGLLTGVAIAAVPLFL
ncbi:hypothetical protein FBU30_001080 [Linnemannia zychae]|nr:hypothetical protein FBU30_001080 [Linnemannia zychae]